MELKFGPEEADIMANLIRFRRPRWAHKAIIDQLKLAALAGASLGQVMSAAEKAMNNPKHLAPAAIMFPENWEETKAKSAGNIAGDKLCIECTTKYPASQVKRHPTGSGYICQTCEDAQ